jgi:hypothetical protein
MSEKLDEMQEQFMVFGIGCILYGIVFTISLYKGFHGITMPILTILTQGLLLWYFRHLHIQIKKSIYFYFAAWIILSISNFLTGSSVMIFFNTCGMTLLFLSFLFIHFCDTSKWGFGKYLLEIFLTPFLFLGYLGYPFKACERYFSKEEKEEGKVSMAKYIWLGIAIAVPLLIIIMALLISADAVFRNLFVKIFADIRFPEHPFYLVFLLATGIIGSYSLLAYFADGKIKDSVGEKTKWEPIVGITFLSIITVVYLIFSVIQISYLFLGSFTLPEGYTYAAYAREGFFQLLFVCLLNLVIILICIARFKENIGLRIILTIFSGCTFIMIASSAMRMILYVQTYQLTFLRLLVLWALVVIFVLLVGCVITIYKNEFPLFRYVTVTVTCFYIVFSLVKPDYLIAKYNLTYAKASMDMDYLISLSTDAIPAMEEGNALADLDWEEFPATILRGKMDDCTEMGILDFNISYYRAGKILKKYNLR